MKILIITENFYPEGNAPARRLYEHSKEWVKTGNQITVLTGVPNFPNGKIYSGYKNKIYQSERIDGINIKRVWTYFTKNKGNNQIAMVYRPDKYNSPSMLFRVSHPKSGYFEGRVNVRTKKGYIYKYKPDPPGTVYGDDIMYDN